MISNAHTVKTMFINTFIIQLSNSEKGRDPGNRGAKTRSRPLKKPYGDAVTLAPDISGLYLM